MIELQCSCLYRAGDVLKRCTLIALDEGGLCRLCRERKCPRATSVDPKVIVVGDTDA